MRMFSSTLRRNVRDCAFQNLKQRLLHAFPGNVTRNRRVFILATDLINFVDVDDALLRAFDVAVRGLQKFENDVLDIFTDIARFGQRRRIYDSERNA